VITRSDISPGRQAAQAAHAAIDFCFEHFDTAKRWNINSNYLIMLSAKDEEHLYRLIEKAEREEIKYTLFREPDLGDTITAIAMEPGEKTRKACSSLPLMLKGL
jgi:peptidyl-tRNA hydrolase